jgi:DNA-binding NarL/FixJ family response regulator
VKPLFLIADDSENKRDMLKLFVEKQLDVALLIAASTEEAKRIIDEHVEISAAFVDYEIPSEEGPAVITYLKHHNPNCHIALVTSSDSAKYKKSAQDAGAEAFICTSWELDRMEEALTTLLSEWHVALNGE